MTISTRHVPWRPFALVVGLAVAQAVAFTGGSGAKAAEGRAGMLNAFAFAAIPPDIPFHVRALDNSEAALELKVDFEEALRGNGHAVSAEAGQLVLTLDSGRQLGERTNFERSQIQLRRRQLEDKVRDRYAVNLFDSESDRPPRAAAAQTIPQTRYRLEATLEDRLSGKVVWRGWTVAALRRGDGRDVVEAMVPILAEVVGETVREEAFQPR